MFQATRWRLEDIESRRHPEGVAAFVPRDDLTSYGTPHDSMVLARAWLAWRELWRTESSLDKAGHDARAEERWMLGKALDGRASESQLAAAYALLEGLVVAVCAPVDPMPRERAVAIFEEHCELVVGRQDPQAS